MTQYLDPPVNPYDPAVQDFEPQRKPPDEIIRQAIKDIVADAKMCMPCQVIKINGNQNVDVQPLLKFRYIDQDSAQPIPAIHHVAVSMPMGKNYSVKLPIDVGDTGYCIFSDRSLDAWLAGGGEMVDPADSRAHDISDAIFVPGLVPFSQQTTDSTTDLVVTNGKAIFKLQRSGKFLAKNDQNELLDVLSQITDKVQSLSNTLSSDTVNTIFGPMKLNAFATYTSIANQLTTLLNKLNTLKGS